MAGRISKQRGVRGELRVVLRKRRWSAAEARLVLDAQRRSGASVAAYARRHGLSQPRLEACRRRLEREASKPSARAELIPVRLVDHGHQARPDAAIEILVRGGRRLRVQSGFDAALLAQVIAVVEGVAC